MKKAAIETRKTDWRLIDQVLSCPAVRTVYLWGEPGIGKTHAGFFLGRVNANFSSVTLTEETAASELRGHYLFEGQNSAWHDGPFTRSMRDGSRLILNEITRANADVWSFLYPVLESMETARFILPNRETIIPAPGFHVIATDNEPPDRLPVALQDRFDCIIHVTEPHPHALSLLSDSIRRVFQGTRELKDGRRLSLRDCFKLERLIPILGLEIACRANFGEERGMQLHDAIRLAEAKG
jgi:MoxR-like ATPase